MEELHKRLAQKIHFIPIRYRMLGGILQSMNIQFGNFLEEVITQIVSLNSNYKIMPESGKKNVLFEQSRRATNFIDEYIINCQDNAYSDIDLKRQFIKILEKVKNSAIEGPFVKIKHDIDLFFLDKKIIITYIVK